MARFSESSEGKRAGDLLYAEYTLARGMPSVDWAEHTISIPQDIESFTYSRPSVFTKYLRSGIYSILTAEFCKAGNSLAIADTSTTILCHSAIENVGAILVSIRRSGGSKTKSGNESCSARFCKAALFLAKISADCLNAASVASHNSRRRAL